MQLPAAIQYTSRILLKTSKIYGSRYDLQITSGHNSLCRPPQHTKSPSYTTRNHHVNNRRPIWAQLQGHHLQGKAPLQETVRARLGIRPLIGRRSIVRPAQSVFPSINQSPSRLRLSMTRNCYAYIASIYLYITAAEVDSESCCTKSIEPCTRDKMMCLQAYSYNWIALIVIRRRHGATRLSYYI